MEWTRRVVRIEKMENAYNFSWEILEGGVYLGVRDVDGSIILK
jgi:hypothetical protein